LIFQGPQPRRLVRQVKESLGVQLHAVVGPSGVP
jgi:hypothetical protein